MSKQLGTIPEATPEEVQAFLKKQALQEKTSSIPPLRIKTKAKEIPVPKPATIITTKAGRQDYNEFFRLFHIRVNSAMPCHSLKEALAGTKGGMYFLPLGFIPGPAVLLQFKEKQVQVVEGTSDVKKGMKIPSPWQKLENLPPKVQQVLVEWGNVIGKLGYEPSPWNFGIARQILEGKLPKYYLSMVIPHFRYRPGDPEKPLGIVLILEEQNLKLLHIYNPQGIPDLPNINTILTLEELINGKGPIQKLLRTWALMEGNYSSRYQNNGHKTTIS
ncbi:MAG: hypothetical protein ABH831_00430 [Candidatus Nealsonbacteria bacterium]